MRRVVITGMGIRSCLGNDLETVTDNLREGRSGVRHDTIFDIMGLRGTSSGSSGVDPAKEIPNRLYRFMGPSAGLAYLSTLDAIEDSGLAQDQVSNPRTGLVMSSSSASPDEQGELADAVREKGVGRGCGHTRVFKTMNSTVSANLATALGIKGMSYSISSACSTSNHCIGNAYEQILLNKADVVFSGGCDSHHWSSAGLLDITRGTSTRNETPETASRPYDKGRDGFVVGSGSGALVLEEYEHAVSRGARIYAELVGYGATSDGYDIISPSGEGAERCMQIALDGLEHTPVDYINTHGTSTPVGDIAELKAIKAVFKDNIPPLGSTKSLSGHSIGASGAHEAIFSILMMNNDFIAASANIEELDPEAEGYPIVQKRVDGPVNCVLSNSFGFGGTNASLVFRKI